MSTHRSNTRKRSVSLAAGVAGGMLAVLGFAGTAQASVNSAFDAGSGTLTVTSDAADGIAIACQGSGPGQVIVNGLAPSGGPANCDVVTKIIVQGGPGANAIDLRGVTDELFVALTGTEISGGGGDDVIDGSELPDAIRGDQGNDRIAGFRNPASGRDAVLGGDGNDTLVWNNGDGSDTMDGEAGDDTVEVNGAAAAGDSFTVNPNGQRVRFDRINLVPFNLDIGTSETLQLNGGGGDDAIAGAPGLATLIKLRMNGGDGNDTLTGGNGDDVMAGGAGNDRLVGAQGRDAMAGNDGDDTMVWNNGDGSDVMDGEAGDDTVAVNGAAAGDDFRVTPNGNRVRFERLNLVPFTLDIGTSEHLDVNAGGGNDRIVGSKGLARLITSSFDGQDGNDRITGTDGADELIGGPGRDVIRSRDRAADQVDCGTGLDRAIVDRRDAVRQCNIVLGGRAHGRLAGRSAPKG
jgi:Ca2+-binding RTX toxin-like protein